MKITREDQQLIDHATQLITKHYCYGKHHVACAVRTKSGNIYGGLHLKAKVGPATVCAEPTAMSAAFTDGQEIITTIVAVKHPNPDDTYSKPKVISPCGVCRELIADYNTDTLVIYPHDSHIEKCPISQLLPHKFSS